MGRWLTELRQLYLPPEPAPAAISDTSTVAEGVVYYTLPHPPPPSSEDVFLRAGLGEVVLLVPGTTVRTAPHPQAEIVEEIEELRRFRVLEHRGEWVRVSWPGERGSGWARPAPPSDGPPLGEEPAPPLPLPGHAPPTDRLAAAEQLLRGSRSTRVGPYLLLSDVEDPVLETHLDLLAGRSEEAYVRRYGLQPVGEPAEAILLFSRLEDYRRFQSGTERLAGVESVGHAAPGIAALFLGDRRREEVGVSLLHELAHLLNRRALGPALPSWLDEGIAEDFSHWGLAESVGPAAYGRFRRLSGDRFLLWGGLASLELVLAAREAGELVSPSRLVELEWEQFVLSDRARLHYAESELWIRFLGHEEDLGAGFESYLEAVRSGEAASGRRLIEHLGIGWTELDRRFEEWVAEEGERVRAELLASAAEP